MAYDGDEFIAIDEDGYVEDRPESTALDHQTRNALFYLGKFGAQCSYSERLDVDSTAAPMYSANPSAVRGPWLIVASEGVGGYTYKMTAAGGPSVAGANEGEAWIEVRSPKYGKISGTKQPITNTADIGTYETYELDIDFGDTLEREELMYVSIMYQSDSYNTDDTDITLNPRPLVAIQDTDVPFARSQKASTEGGGTNIEVIYDSSGSTNRQPGAPTVTYVVQGGVGLGGDVLDLTYIASPHGELKEKRSTFDPYDSFDIRAHDSSRGAAIPPWWDRGAGANYGASEQVFGRWHTSSLGTQYGDKPNSDWDEFQRWIYIEGADVDVTKSVPFEPINDNIRLSFSFPLLGYRASTFDVNRTDELTVIDTEDVDFSIELIKNGSSIQTITETVPVEFHSRNLGGSYPIFVQLDIRSTFTSPSPRWTFREGQIFDIPSGIDEHNILTPFRASEEVTGLTAGDIYQVRYTFSSPVDADNSYIIAGQPVLQQYVTDTRE